MKRFSLIMMLSASVALLPTGCSDEAETGETAPIDGAATTDGGGDTATTVGGGEGGGGDGATGDTTAVDGGEDTGDTGPAEFQPIANVYASNPIDEPETVEVMLNHLTAPDHTLQGQFADVYNCLPDLENGTQQTLNVGIPLDITTCVPTHKAVPGDDNTYRHITPPEDPGSNDDSMAEVMMYHHMNEIHDYYANVHGLTDLDYPLQAYVNIQTYVQLCQEWASIGNAAFLPAEAAGQSGLPFDFGQTGDAIIFGQTPNKDFSYDADVIYHEYTHAMVGATRLNAVFPDSQGLNNLPGALNEAYADYFAGTLANESVIGNYALNDVEPMTVCGFPLGAGGGNLARDMTAERTCPEDLTAEVHADGEIFASALWAIRSAIGPDKADGVIMGALVGFSQTTGFSQAADATIARAKSDLDAADAAMVEQVLTDRGLVGCKRVVAPNTVGARGIPLRFEGSDSFALNPFGDFVPGYLQFQVELPPGVTEIKVAVFAQGDLNIEAAWKPGDQEIVYSAPFAPGSDAFVTKPFESGGGNQWTTRLSGTCLSGGKWSFGIHNKGGAFSISQITTWAKTDPVDDPNFDAPCGN